MKVSIQPNSALNSGVCQTLLRELQVGMTATFQDGTIYCDMTQAQLDLFKLRGASHRVTILPDEAAELPAEPAAAAPEATAPMPEQPLQQSGPPVVIIETSPGVFERHELATGSPAPVEAPPAAEAEQPAQEPTWSTGRNWKKWKKKWQGGGEAPPAA